MNSLSEIIKYLFSPTEPTLLLMLFVIFISVISNYYLLQKIKFSKLKAFLIAVIEIPITIYLTTAYFYYIENARDIHEMSILSHQFFVPLMLLVTIPVHILIWLRWKYKINKKNKSI